MPGDSTNAILHGGNVSDHDQMFHNQMFQIMQELGPSSELVLCSVLADGVAPEAVLGVCPVDVQPESKLASPSRQRCHYWCTASKLGAVADWGKLLFDSTVEQYGDMCKSPP